MDLPKFFYGSDDRKAFVWALGMHALLLVFLTIGISWKSQTPAGLEAEIWDNVPVIKSTSSASMPSVMADENADIAMKKKKEAAKEAAKPQVDSKAQQKKQKAEEERLAKLKEDKKKEQEKLKSKEKEKQKEQAEKEERAKALALEKARADQVARLRAAAGKEGAAGGRGGVVGDGVGGGGNAKPGYADKVRKKILPLIVFNPSTVVGNPSVEVGVELAPDGTILGRKILKTSGDVTWEKAVLRALDDAATLPKDDDGKVPRQIRLTFKPKD